jgi:hypothetical protein
MPDYAKTVPTETGEGLLALELALGVDLAAGYEEPPGSSARVRPVGCVHRTSPRVKSGTRLATTGSNPIFVIVHPGPERPQSRIVISMHVKSSLMRSDMRPSTSKGESVLLVTGRPVDVRVQLALVRRIPCGPPRSARKSRIHPGQTLPRENIVAAYSALLSQTTASLTTGRGTHD